jgi:sarcosine oxidase subunit gamma
MPEPVRIADRGPVGMVTLKADLDAPAVATAVRAATGCALPEVRRIAFADGNAAAWMAPDELMLFVAPGAAGAAIETLAATLGSAHYLATDVSDARVVFRIEGAGAREVLAKGAPVDLAPAAFGPGDFRRTRLGQVAVAFWCVEPAHFELMCFRSVGGFVADWLAGAAAAGSLPGFLAPGAAEGELLPDSRPPAG